MGMAGSTDRRNRNWTFIVQQEYRFVNLATASVIYWQHLSLGFTMTISAVRVPIKVKVTSSLVLHLAADRDDMGRARRAERLLHTLGDTECRNKNPTRLGRAPSEKDANSCRTRCNTKRKRGQRDARREPDADEPGECERDEGCCHMG